MNIVVLDASSTARNKIEDLLVKMGFEDVDIHLFEDGEQALDFVRQEGADIIFSSLEADGIDGITFVDIILQENPAIVSKLFIVTSQTASEGFSDVKGVGAKRFIKKPINSEYFNHMIVPEIDRVLKGIGR